MGNVRKSNNNTTSNINNINKSNQEQNNFNIQKPRVAMQTMTRASVSASESGEDIDEIESSNGNSWKPISTFWSFKLIGGASIGGARSTRKVVRITRKMRGITRKMLSVQWFSDSGVLSIGSFDNSLTVPTFMGGIPIQIVKLVNPYGPQHGKIPRDS